MELNLSNAFALNVSILSPINCTLSLTNMTREVDVQTGVPLEIPARKDSSLWSTDNLVGTGSVPDVRSHIRVHYSETHGSVSG